MGTQLYEDKRERLEFWDFRKLNTKEFTHGIHPYPGMMIPQVARELIKLYGKNSKSILDPFVGSGSTLVEAFLTDNIQTLYGFEINPLAILIAKVKTQEINLKEVKKYSRQLNQKYKTLKDEIIDFKNIDFWFKKNIIKELSKIRKFIFSISNEPVRDFFLVTFSETVRKVSNQKKREFKLVKMKPEQLKKQNPNVLNVFNQFLEKNIKAILEFKDHIGDHSKDINIYMHNSTKKEFSIKKNSVDLLVTSPPYGDSRTTVAYGQFSRLNSQWIGFDNDVIMNVDKECLGGKASKGLLGAKDLKSPTLQESIQHIAFIDEKRAREVLSFYIDFDKCINEINRIMKKGSYLCFVVGNRTVKKHKLKTDVIISELFVNRKNYAHEKTIIREIYSKRMPKKNSPTNKKGEWVETMNNEYIVILKKL